jgi:hypothetical protein
MILALYAISKTSVSFKNRSKPKIYFRPHEIQVVTILLLLGIATCESQVLKNCMAQVGTGEGKSIILATMNAYLALVGFNMRCACYS